MLVVFFHEFVLLLVDPTRPWLKLVYTISQEFRQQDCHWCGHIKHVSFGIQ